MKLLQMSVAAGVMIAAIVVIRVLTINNLPKKMFHVLWIIVLARLLIPVTIPSPLSVYSFIGHSGIVDINQSAWSITSPENTSSVPMAADISPWVVIWLFGFALCALYFMLTYFKCKREFVDNSPMTDDFIEDWLKMHHLKRKIAVCQSNRVKAPVTFGIFQPVILLPTWPDCEGTENLGFILQHEYVHIRRLDALTKVLLTVAVCTHWFNPLVWIMYILFNLDMELSCDEKVIQSFGESAKSAYALTLISMEEKKLGFAHLYSGFNENKIEKRINAIMKYRQYTRVAIATAIFLVGGLSICFATSSNVEAKNSVSSALPPQFDSQYLRELEYGQHTGDLDPENVLAECLSTLSGMECNIGAFELIGDQPNEKMYASEKNGISICLVAYEITTSKGDNLRIWSAQPYRLYFSF